MNFEFEGLLFDLDGTLVDSSEAIVRAWEAFASKYGIDMTEAFHAIQGKPSGEAIAALRPDASPEEIALDFRWFEDMESNDTDRVIALPSAVELLETLNRENIPWAIVTSGTVPVASARIKAVGLPYPEILVTPELVSKGKPDPEPYLLGASKLGIDIQKCIVFEDAPAGARSGVSAGARVIGVLTQFDTAALFAEQASVCVSSMLDVALVLDGERPVLSVLAR